MGENDRQPSCPTMHRYKMGREEVAAVGLGGGGRGWEVCGQLAVEGVQAGGRGL